MTAGQTYEKAESQTSGSKPFSGFGNIAFARTLALVASACWDDTNQLKARGRLETIKGLEHYSYVAVQLITTPNRET